jgi:hypothetical protein
MLQTLLFLLCCLLNVLFHLHHSQGNITHTGENKAVEPHTFLYKQPRPIVVTEIHFSSVLICHAYNKR